MGTASCSAVGVVASPPVCSHHFHQPAALLPSIHGDASSLILVLLALRVQLALNEVFVVVVLV
jgi:hypothetical protein